MCTIGQCKQEWAEPLQQRAAQAAKNRQVSQRLGASSSQCQSVHRVHLVHSQGCGYSGGGRLGAAR